MATTSGNSGKGKFGHIDQFAHCYTTDSIVDAFSPANHDIENYLSSIVQGEVRCQSPYSQTAIHCPVDVEVLKNGTVVGRIVDNQVDEDLMAANPEVALMVVEDSKRVAVFDSPEAYSLRITATDDGEMSVSTVSFDDSGESYGAAEYPNVEIETGQVFSMELPAADSAGSDPQTPELLVMDGDRISGKVNPDGSISPVNGTGNWLQLALLAAVAILGVLITFLGGRKNEGNKKTKISDRIYFCGDPGLWSPDQFILAAGQKRLDGQSNRLPHGGGVWQHLLCSPYPLPSPADRQHDPAGGSAVHAEAEQPSGRRAGNPSTFARFYAYEFSSELRLPGLF